MIRAALTAFALLAATPAFAQEAAPQYYRLDISVVRKGVEVVSTHTQIVEGYPAGASATLGDVTYDFEANLFSVQGDGDTAQMVVEAHLARGESEIAAPRLSFLRGQMAEIAMGEEAGDVLKMSIMPVFADD
ncbi:hypothetical protein [Brevundimonas nasdae]|uniref:hypothetical protein n=1 Tax=Brevundimonas nasdae TaxID=172043 RepID=UPI003018C6E7